MNALEYAETFAVDEARRLATKYGKTWGEYLAAFEKALVFWLPEVE